MRLVRGTDAEPARSSHGIHEAPSRKNSSRPSPMYRADLAASACEGWRPLPHGRRARRGGFDRADQHQRHYRRSGARIRIRKRGGPAGNRKAWQRRAGVL